MASPYIHSLCQSFSTIPFFSIPCGGDPEPRQLFAGLDIAYKQDICMEHMGKYRVIFCDFKVRISSLQTFQKTRSRAAVSRRPVLGGSAFELQRLSFRPLHGVERLSHAVS